MKPRILETNYVYQNGSAIPIHTIEKMPAQGYRDNKLTDHLSGFHGLGGNKPYFIWNGKR